jgi:hypothetical protein
MSFGMSYYVLQLAFPEVLKACSGFQMSGNTVKVTQCHIQYDVNPHTPYIQPMYGFCNETQDAE